MADASDQDDLSPPSHRRGSLILIVGVAGLAIGAAVATFFVGPPVRREVVVSRAPPVAFAKATVSGVPEWARVSDQVAEADRLAVLVAFENKIGLRFVLIPPGKFTMGSSFDEVGRRDDEWPHDVSITRALGPIRDHRHLP